MCVKCTSTAVFANLLGQGYCINCYNNLKICDSCERPHLFPDEILYNEEMDSYICHTCSGSEVKTCPKCGLSYLGDNPMCSGCSEKYFECVECGKHKTYTRSGLNDYDKFQYSHVLQGDTCKKCFDGIKANNPPQPTRHCLHCSELTHNDTYCDRCLEHRHTCEDCGVEYVSYDNAYQDGKLRCNLCKSKYFHCNTCDTWYLNAEKSRDHYMTCKDCVKNSVSCSKCGDLTKGKAVNGTDFVFCDHCYSSYVSTCQVCGEKKFDLYCGICPSCRLGTGFGQVRSYTVKMPIKLKGHREQPHYGIENEVSMRGGIEIDFGRMLLQRDISSSDMILKHDSSVSNGFECVWRPFTLKEFTDYDFSVAFNDKVFRQSDSCGMHIHINKKAFKTTHMYKFMKFIHESDEFINMIAERSPTNYCQKTYHKLERLAKTKTNSGRGQINLNNQSTIEVRIFAGVTSQEQFRKNVEFMDALFYYTKDCSIPDSVNVDKFVKYIKDSRYVNLKKFVSEGWV